MPAEYPQFFAIVQGMAAATTVVAFLMRFPSGALSFAAEHGFTPGEALVDKARGVRTPIR
jgi:hypothetical protein